jgi:hypothetical protein
MELLGLEEETFFSLLDKELHGMVLYGSLLEREPTQLHSQPMELVGLKLLHPRLQLMDMELDGMVLYGWLLDKEPIHLHTQQTDRLGGLD